MPFKQLNLIYRYRKLITKHKNILVLHNNVKSCSTIVNEKRKENKFDGPSLKDFIAKDFPPVQTELVHDDDKIPYVDMVNLGQNRKGKQI